MRRTIRCCRRIWFDAIGLVHDHRRRLEPGPVDIAHALHLVQPVGTLPEAEANRAALEADAVDDDLHVLDE